MSEHDDELLDLLAKAYLEGKDVETPAPARRKTALAVAQRLLDNHNIKDDD